MTVLQTLGSEAVLYINNKSEYFAILSKKYDASGFKILQGRNIAR
jgi:hypothetical protein